VKGRAGFQVGRLVREGRTKRPEGSDPVADEAMERLRRIARLACRNPMIGFVVRHRDRPRPAYLVLVGRMRGQRLRDDGGQQCQENGCRNRRSLAAEAFSHACEPLEESDRLTLHNVRSPISGIKDQGAP